jgi:glycerophosphoryl diester phosphodiesterase
MAAPPTTLLARDASAAGVKCAECDCQVTAGKRVVLCGDASECCCADVPRAKGARMEYRPDPPTTNPADLPGPGDPARQLWVVADAMAKEGRDDELGISYDMDFLELVKARSHEARIGADQLAVLTDCHKELDPQGKHPGRVATHNILLTRLVAANLLDMERRGVSLDEAGRHFRDAAKFQAARDRLEP